MGFSQYSSSRRGSAGQNRGYASNTSYSDPYSQRHTTSSGGFNSHILGGVATPRHQHLARPVYDPIDMSGIDASKKRMQGADRLADDPLSAPGVQQQLGVISEGLNRQFAAQKGDAMSHAAQSGQAGFGGAFAQTAAQLSGSLASTRSQEQSNMMMDVYTKARAEGLSANEAMMSAQADVSRIKNERSRIDADITNQEASLWQKEQSDYQSALLEQARQAEDARQFNERDKMDRDRFAYDKTKDSRNFAYESSVDERNFNETHNQHNRANDSRNRELDNAEQARVESAFNESYAQQRTGQPSAPQQGFRDYQADEDANGYDSQHRRTARYGSKWGRNLGFKFGNSQRNPGGTN